LNNIDIAIIGAGSAGSIIANKLLSETNFNIALIEAGPKDNNPIIDVPLGYGMTFYNKKINWNFYSEKQDNLFNRQIYYPRGKVLGGSGSINAMVYARGLETDYENWGSSKEWSFENINNVSKYHHPILEYFFNASNEIGIKKNTNLTTSIENQVGHYNINTYKGTRHSSSKVFLKPVLKNPRLTVLDNTQVKNLIIKDKKITGIKIQNKSLEQILKLSHGAILCSGSIMTPYLLMHSGIGDKDHLKQYDKEIIIDNSNVGRNLQDHLGLDYLFKTHHHSLNKSLGTWSGRITSVLRYLYNRTGPLSLSINQSGGYINWNSKHHYPNLQIYFNPLTYSITHKNKRPLLKTDKFNGFIIGYNSCRPKSLGTVTLNSPNFGDTPLINPNFLSHEEDIYDVKCAINFSKVLANTNNIKKIRNESVTHDLLNATEEEMIDHFKSNAVSIYHPCGTCKMDEDPKKGVVSERLKVHGMENLWIADASVFPNITSGNINAPVMMLANLGSKFIIEDLKKFNL
jgi:choline dehydrogenase